MSLTGLPIKPKEHIVTIHSAIIAAAQTADDRELAFAPDAKLEIAHVRNIWAYGSALSRCVESAHALKAHGYDMTAIREVTRIGEMVRILSQKSNAPKDDKSLGSLIEAARGILAKAAKDRDADETRICDAAKSQVSRTMCSAFPDEQRRGGGRPKTEKAAPVVTLVKAETNDDAAPRKPVVTFADRADDLAARLAAFVSTVNHAGKSMAKHLCKDDRDAIMAIGQHLKTFGEAVKTLQARAHDVVAKADAKMKALEAAE